MITCGAVPCPRRCRPLPACRKSVRSLPVNVAVIQRRDPARLQGFRNRHDRCAGGSLAGLQDRYPRFSDLCRATPFCEPTSVDKMRGNPGEGDRMVKYLLTAAAVYLGAVGVALLLAPVQFGVDAVPRDASPELVSLLRLLGGPFLGIAVLNWMSRTAELPEVRNLVLLANLVGFGVVAANDVVGVITGDARDLARVFLIVHVSFTAVFAVAWVRGAFAPSRQRP